MCGAQNGVEIEHWGHAKAAWLAEFLGPASGIPSHDTRGRVLAVLDPASLQQAFVSWMNALADRHQALVTLDGKTLRRSLDSADGKGPIHVANAWAFAHEVVLAQFTVDAKTNEMTAMPELLRMLNLTGAVMSIEAMGCRGEIAWQIPERGADDVLSFKDNQPSLYRDGADLCTWLRGLHPLDQRVVFGDDAQVDGGHGRLEIRRVWSIEALAGVVSGERWPGLTSLVEEYRAKLQTARAVARLLQVVDLLFAQPVLTARQVQAVLEVDIPAAQRYVHQLADAGLLHEVAGKARTRVYRADCEPSRSCCIQATTHTQEKHNNAQRPMQRFQGDH